MIISHVQQGTDEWFAERAGKVTASNFDKIITSTGAQTASATRATYLYQLAGERITGNVEQSFTTPWMERGKDLEEEARLYFEQQRGLFVQQIGMIYQDEAREVSCSPDGFIPETNEGLEIKCPKLSTHVGYLDKGQLPTAYKQQVQGSMMVSGLQAWWFMSYYPGMPPLVIKVARDDGYIATLFSAVRHFNDQVNALVERLKGKDVEPKQYPQGHNKEDQYEAYF